MTLGQQSKRRTFNELPVRMYPASRIVHVFSSLSPQLTKSTDLVIVLFDKLLECEGKDISIASSEQKIPDKATSDL